MKGVCAVRGNEAAESETVMDKTKKLKVGDHIIFVDSHGVQHNALVTTWWLGGVNDGGAYRSNASIDEFEKTYGDGTRPSVNLTYIDQDPSHTDQYGAQKKHETSVTHGDRQTPPRLGNCWLFASEVSE